MRLIDVLAFVVEGLLLYAFALTFIIRPYREAKRRYHYRNRLRELK